MDNGESNALSEPAHQQSDNGNPPKRNRKEVPGKRHGARNQHRHVHFAKWLEQRFLKSFQQASYSDSANNKNHIEMHILDVAGGKGELTARLAMCLQQKVVLVDPRSADVVDCFETLVLPKIPNKWQKRIQERRAENPDFVRDAMSQRVRQLVTTFDENSLSHDDQIQQAVVNASLLIGLHADGATEAIVDASLRYRKPFVVVPCCVFPSFFPLRHVVMERGQPSVPVRTHPQFCQYLLQKHPGFRLEILPFEGRNVAIWWDGETDGRSENDAKVSGRVNN
jgi:Methyltransferase domain